MNKLLIFFLLFVSLSISAQTQLIIPDTLVGPNFNLSMHKDSVQFFPTGKKSKTYAYNLNNYLGPTLIFNKGNNVSITVNNQIGDTTTVHWHPPSLKMGWWAAHANFTKCNLESSVYCNG